MKSMLAKIAATVIFFAFVPCAKAQLSATGVEQPITYSGKVASLAANTPALNFSTPTGTNTFILASQPETAARIYIVNETANACTTVFQVTVATTAQKNIGSFNNSPQNWAVVPIINTLGNYAANSGLITIPANGSVVLTSAAVAGQNVAVFVVNTTGACASTSIDVLVEFATVSITSPLINVASGNNIVPAGTVANVQGVQPVAGSLAVVNPVAIGGKNVAGTNSFIGVATNTDTGGSTYNTIPIGGTSLSSTAALYSGLVFPQDNLRGPLAATAMAVLNDGTGFNRANLQSTAAVASANSNAPGLFTTNTGYHKAVGPVGFTVTGQTFGLVTPPGFGSYHSCYMTLELANTGGTTPTLDIYFQTSSTGNTWTDRIHFPQYVSGATNQNQYAGLSGVVAGITPVAETDRTIAAGTKIDGPLPQWMRFIIVVGGTGPSYNITYGLDCT